MTEENKSNIIEGINILKTMGGGKKGFGKTTIQEIIGGKKALRGGRRANFAKFED